MKQILTIAIALLLGASIAIAQEAVSTAPSPKPSPSPSGTSEVERVVVSGGEIESSETDKAQSVTILSEDNLKLQTQPTLGDTLATQPGVGGSGFTAGASRPVIRGQADNRVRVLNNGTEVFDVSNFSPDHAPSVSTLLSQSIEVVRGPATILYGSGAIGGVVNVTDNLIPVEQPPTTLSGEVDARFNSVDLERSGAMALTLSPFKHFVVHAEGSLLRTDDRSIPGFRPGPTHSRRAHARAATQQRLWRESVWHSAEYDGETKDFGIGASYVWDKGYFGASYTRFLSEYGVPNDPEVDEPGVPPARVHLNVRKDQYNVRSSIIDPLPWFSVANLKFVYTDYKHDELDSDNSRRDVQDERCRFAHRTCAPTDRAWSKVRSAHRYFTRIFPFSGEEAFLQPTHNLAVAGFIFEEVKLNPVRLQFGARVESNSVSIDSSDPELTSLTSPSQKDQEFWPISGAAGALYDFAKDWQLALNLTYSQRAPTPEELFARGPHDATFQFIIGDPNLDVEINRSVDLSLRRTAGRVTGFISGYYTSYDGFIDFAPTGEIEDGLQVFVYTPKNATFYGGEGRVDFHLLPLEITRSNEPSDSKSVKNVIMGGEETTQKNPNDLYLRLQADYVHAEDSSGEPLPRITPFRYGISLNYESEHWLASIEGWRVDAQNRVAEFETPTPATHF